jgi:hypothetical protein
MSRALRFALPLLLVAPVGCLSAGDDDDEHGPVTEGISSPLVTTGGLVADSYVRSTQASTNFGTAATLLVDGSDGGAVMHTYLKFSIGNVGTITSAKLRLFVKDPSNGPNEVRLVPSSTWTETGITWSNKPATSTLVATIGNVSDETWIEVDITSVAQPNSTISLAIVPGTNNGLDLSSRNATSNQPQIVIDANGGTGGTTGTAGTTGGAGTTGSGGTTGTAGTTGSGGARPSTDPNLKIAFVGDTADGANWRSVLQLALNEGAAAVVTAGDMTYDADPVGWWSATETVVGQSYPVFLARGNHDDTSWSGFLGEAANHLSVGNRVAGPHNAAYKTIYRGLDIVTIQKGDTGTTISNLFGSDNHIWKVCNWHQNMAKLQVGGKGDEMGYPVYDMCRQKGAIIITGHEHTYHRTKTITNMATQTIDSTCSGGASVCVGPGRTILSVVGTGGTGLRSQIRCTPTSATAPFPSLNTSDASCPIWASIYTTNQGVNFGAQFITFNVDGDPKKATSYFKTISGTRIDDFTIFAD